MEESANSQQETMIEKQAVQVEGQVAQLTEILLGAKRVDSESSPLKITRISSTLTRISDELGVIIEEIRKL